LAIIDPRTGEKMTQMNCLKINFTFVFTTKLLNAKKL
jgi:hypothetical protein